MDAVAEPAPADTLATPEPGADPTPAPVDSTPEPSPWYAVGEDGRFAEDYTDRLPDDLKDSAAMLANIRDPETMAKALKDNMTAARAKVEGMVKIPGEGATEEEIGAFREAIGVPKDPEGYGLAAPEGADNWNEQAANDFAALMHAEGVPKATVEKIIAFQAGMAGSEQQLMQDIEANNLAQEKSKLMKAWGSAYDENFTGAQQVLATVGLKPDHPIFKHADSMQAMAKLSKLIQSDKLVSADTLNGEEGLRARAAKLVAEPDYEENKTKQETVRNLLVKANELGI